MITFASFTALVLSVALLLLILAFLGRKLAYGPCLANLWLEFAHYRGPCINVWSEHWVQINPARVTFKLRDSFMIK